MTLRTDLHNILCDILGSTNVYFQPPSTIRLKFPCVLYELSGIDTNKADNTTYIYTKRYKVTFVDKNPDATQHLKMLTLPTCTFDTWYTSEDYNYFVYTLYF